MRGNENRRARAVDALEQTHDAQGGLGIEIAGRLVANENRRSVDDGARNRNALLLTAGKLIGKLVHLVLEANEAEHLGHLRADDVT